jgi:hypothetical protein
MSEVQPSRSIWQMAARPLMAGAAMCVVAAAIAGGANWLAQRVASEQGKAQAALDAANLSLQNTQSDRARLEENLQLFGKLKQFHFAHKPDRLAILEALESATSAFRKSTLVWELGPEEKLRPLTDDKTGEAVASLVRVPMKLSASGVHEEEWLNLLRQLQGTGAGYFTADSCAYLAKTFNAGERSAPAAEIQCKLSWLYAVAENTSTKPP